MQLFNASQSFSADRIDDVTAACADALGTFNGAIGAGSSVAVAVGSRGIANLALIVRSTVEYVKRQGGRPFIVPAMGSHGGATAEGQKAVLAGYGVTEETVGAPVRSSMETVRLEPSGCDVPLFVDRAAYEADGILLINRIKPHTDFHGPYESGLVKMGVIGLGKQAMALEIHRYGVYGLERLIPRAFKALVDSCRIIGGVAVVENAYDETLLVRAVKGGRILSVEPELLDIARRAMPSLPLSDIDVLIVDRLGKDVSGTGLDTNIIGRMYIRGVPEPQTPRITALMVADVTAASHGNALGVGFADVISRRLFDRIDFSAMYENVYTSTFYERAKIPVVAETDAQAFEYACRLCGPKPVDSLRVLRIPDTLRLGRFLASRPALEAMRRPVVTGEPAELFDATGRLAAVDWREEG